MTDAYVLISYLATYGLIAGYVFTLWNRLRRTEHAPPEEG